MTPCENAHVIPDGRVLVLCTGNVCRSPYIERRLRQELADTAIDVSSAGTGALVGHPMHDSTRALLEGRRADIAEFEGRRLTADQVRSADLVIAAAREHRSAASTMVPVAFQRIVTLRDLADLLEGVSVADILSRSTEESWVARVLKSAQARRAVVPARQTGVDITDPIGQPPHVFERMASEVEDALDVIVPVLRGPAR
jgi:protein-tyrosine phosphatase